MGKEIERKFLVRSQEFKAFSEGILYKQGYLHSDSQKVIRIRVYRDEAYITIKSKVTGISRLEYEYPIPAGDANEILDKLCRKPFIEKYRYTCEYKGFTWEIDEFCGENQGLIIAEIELQREDQAFERPEWVGEEVTGDSRYYNSSLVSNPYTRW